MIMKEDCGPTTLLLHDINEGIKFSAMYLMHAINYYVQAHNIMLVRTINVSMYVDDEVSMHECVRHYCIMSLCACHMDRNHMSCIVVAMCISNGSPDIGHLVRISTFTGVWLLANHLGPGFCLQCSEMEAT